MGGNQTNSFSAQAKPFKAQEKTKTSKGTTHLPQEQGHEHMWLFNCVSSLVLSWNRSSSIRYKIYSDLPDLVTKALLLAALGTKHSCIFIYRGLFWPVKRYYSYQLTSFAPFSKVHPHVSASVFKTHFQKRTSRKSAVLSIRQAF